MKPKSLPSRLFDRNPAGAETLNVQAAKYQRHVDCADHQESVYHSSDSDDHPAAENSRQNEKSHREIHLAFVSERYEPLIDDEAQAKATEEKKKRKEMYKKVKKVSVLSLNFLKMLFSELSCVYIPIFFILVLFYQIKNLFYK